MNAANATKLGLLDSSVVDVLANRLPLGGLGLSAMRGYGQNRVAEDLAALLVNPAAASSALGLLNAPSQANALARLLEQQAYRAGPVIAADR
jgi:hypothetical protein